MCNSVRQKLSHTRPYSLLLNIAHSTTVQRNAELHLSNCHSKIKDCKAEESCTLPTICLTRSLEGKIQFSIWGKLHTKSGIQQSFLLKFIYSEKAAKFCEIFTLLLSHVVPVKSKVKISQNFVAFSEYMNFKRKKKPISILIFFVLESLCL